MITKRQIAISAYFSVVALAGLAGSNMWGTANENVRESMSHEYAIAQICDAKQKRSEECDYTEIRGQVVRDANEALASAGKNTMAVSALLAGFGIAGIASTRSRKP